MPSPLNVPLVSSSAAGPHLHDARARQRFPWRRLLPVQLVMGLCAATANAAPGAEPQFAEDARAALQQDAAVQTADYEMTSAVMPSVGGFDPFWQTTVAGPSGNHFNSTQHLDLTRWLTPESANSQGRFGVLLGMSGPGPSAASASSVSGSFSPASLDMGLRWRSRLESGRHLDVSAWTRAPQWSQPQDAISMIWQAQQPLYGTRVEVQWASSRTRGLVPEFGAIGVQLQGGSRLVLRARKGGPMLYYRARF